MFQRTKKLFKRSIETFKSYFSDTGYQKLPKTPSYDANFSPKNIYTEFVDQREASDRVITSSYEKNIENSTNTKQSMLINHHEETTFRGEEKRRLVTKRLKELELFGGNNVDHVHDIQEVLNCYSRLTCPAYCEIVEKFFLDIYSEVFSLPCLNGSVPRRMHVRV